MKKVLFAALCLCFGGFLAACAKLLMAALGGIAVTEPTNAVTAMFMELEDGHLRVALKNKGLRWATPAGVSISKRA